MTDKFKLVKGQPLAFEPERKKSFFDTQEKIFSAHLHDFEDGIAKSIKLSEVPMAFATSAWLKKSAKWECLEIDTGKSVSVRIVFEMSYIKTFESGQSSKVTETIIPTGIKHHFEDLVKALKEKGLEIS